jgi:hypothetical protein
MQKYNPVNLQVNMPVLYIENRIDNHWLSGHYAGIDEDGYHYVFENGGTSFTRTTGQLTKVFFLRPMLDTDDDVIKTNYIISNHNSKTFTIYPDSTGVRINL